MLWFVLALLLLCSGIISATETALFGLSSSALRDLRRAPGGLRRRAYRMMSVSPGPRRVLMTVLMANTGVNVTIFTVAFFALRQLGERYLVIATLGGLAVPFLLIVFGEVLPKAVALSSPRTFAPAASGLIAVLHVALGPIQWLLSRSLVEPITRLLAPSSGQPDAVTTEELRLLVEQASGTGVINSSENEMLQAVVALGDVSVREVMTPRVDIRSVPIDGHRAAAVEVVRQSGCRRLVVCGRDLDDVRGVLYGRDLFLRPDAAIKSLVRHVHHVPEQVNLLQLMDYFRAEGIHLAVVVDEFGGTAGLVTMEDVAEWIIGPLPDAETPRPATPTERIDESTYRLAGDLSIRAWADRFRVDEMDRHVDTIAGLILAKLGRLPRIGDFVRIRNLTLTVEVMRGRRIERVLMRQEEEDVADEPTPASPVGPQIRRRSS